MRCICWLILIMLGNKVFPRIRQRQWNSTLGQQILVLGLAGVYYDGGNMKKANFHYEVAAMAGHEEARFNLGIMDAKSGKME